MKLWKGRFSKAATSSADEFNASIEFDQRLYKEDIQGSIAHASMLAKQGIISEEDSLLIIKTLKEILEDIEKGNVEFTIESEDIHMNIESILTERIGDAGKKLHTARSRNDQIAVDIRLYLKKETEYGWYLCMNGDKIVGGMGVIENDFHDRKDLTPNVCAVYTEKDYRCKGIAGHLLNMVVEDMKSKGITPVYLVTDHTGFYERYGWEFLCMVQGDGEPNMTRMYIHR